MWIFVGFPRERASNDSGVIENVDFYCFQMLNLGGNLYEMRPTLLYSIIYSLVAFPLTHKYVALSGHFMLNSILRWYAYSSEARLSELHCS